MTSFYFNLALYFVVGTIIGSFLSVVITRFNTDEGIIFGRSRCPQCKQTLTALELVPILAFLAFRGRCRHCRNKIGLLYPALELLMGLLFAGLYFRFAGAFLGYNLTIFLLIYGLGLAALVAIFFIDARTYLVPDKIVLPGILLLLLLGLLNLVLHNDFGANFFIYSPDIGQFILGPIIGGGFFLLLVLISKEKWMGWGDVKLGTFIGLLLGWPLILVALFSAFILGSVFSLVLIALKKKTRQDIIPFAPFLVCGFLVALFFGKYIIQWYLGV